MAAVASAAEELKLPEEAEYSAVRSGAHLIVLSAAVKRSAPILGASNVALWAESGAVKVEVTHRESMRTFSAHLRAEDLEKCGFHPRDTAEDCVEIMSDALGAEDIDTVAVTPMASPLEGSDTDTACVKVPFSDCEFLRIFFALKFRKKLYEYSFVALEQKLDAATRTQLEMLSLKRTVKAQSQQMEVQKTEMEAMKEAINAHSQTEKDLMKKIKVAMELMEATKKAMKTQSKTEIDSVKEAMEEKIEAMKAQSKKEMDAMKVAIEESEEKTAHQIEALKSKGILSFRSNAMVERSRKWNRVELAPTLRAMGALSRDQSDFRIGTDGVYRVLTAVCIRGKMGSGYAQLWINDVNKCALNGGNDTSTVLSFVGRLRVGATVRVEISAKEDNNFYGNCLQIEKL